MANVQEIVAQFARIQSGKNSEIADAEAVLCILRDKSDFLFTLLSIPRMSGVQQYTAKMSVTYAMTFARHIVAKHNQAFINVSANLMLEFLTCGDVKFELRQQVAAALEYLIRMDKNGIILSVFQPNYISLLQNAQSAEFSAINFDYLALFGQIIADYGANPANPTFPFIPQAIIPMATLCYKVIEYGAGVIGSSQNEGERALLIGSIFLECMQKFLKKYLFLSYKVTETLFDPIFSQLINLCLGFALPDNILSTTVIYWNQKHQFVKSVMLLHRMKANCITVLTQIIRILFHTKQYDGSSAQLAIQAPQFIREFIRSMDNLLENTQYYKLQSASQVRVLEEIILFLSAVVRMGKYYADINQQRNQLIFGALFKILALSPDDYDRYYHNPDEFLHTIMQIVDLNSTAALKNKRKQIENKMKKQNTVTATEQYEEEDEDYATVRTLAASLMSQVVKYLDGSLTEIMFYCVAVMDDRINMELSKNLMLLVICILRDEVKHRDDLKSSIGKVLLSQLKELGLPRKSEEEPYNIEYSLSLLALSRYALLIHEYYDSFFEKIFVYVELLLTDDKVEQTPKLIACQLITTFLAVEEGAIFSQKILAIFNRILNSVTINRKYLECLDLLIKENSFEFKDDLLPIHTTVERISALLQWQSKKNSPDLMTMDLLWHILTEVASSQYLMPGMCSKLEEVLLPLLSMSDGSSELHIDDNLYQLGCALIKRKLHVGQFEIKLLETIPKSFYTDKNKYSLLGSFELIQNIIFLGSEILGANIPAMKTLVLLCIDSINTKTANEKPRSESDQCEGVLTLQSLLISCGRFFDLEMWNMVAKNIAQKISSNTVFYDFYKASLVNVLSLIFMYTHKLFNEADSTSILSLLLQNYHCFETETHSNIFLISMSELLLSYQVEIIQKNFIVIMDCLVTLLKLKSMDKNKAFNMMETDSEEKHFKKLKDMCRTTLDDIDQFKYFRTKVQALKEQCPQVLEHVFRELPEIKKGYFNDVTHVKKVNDEPRMIFKIRAPATK